jgi:hypothetical protein
MERFRRREESGPQWAGQQGGACLGRQESSLTGLDQMIKDRRFNGLLIHLKRFSNAHDSATQCGDFQETSGDGQEWPVDGEKKRES